MNYLIIGGSGLIGSRFVELAKKNNKILSPDETKLDITDEASVEDYFTGNKDKFDIVINFAAYTDVSGAEKEKGNKKGIIWRLNADGAENVARACQSYFKFLIHISTDFIFPGTKENPGPYSEGARLPRKIDNVSWYGWTKLEGEKRVRSLNKGAAVVRTAYPFRASPYPLKLDFARTILDLYDQKKLFPLFWDLKITPVFIDDLVRILERIAKLGRGGIYNVASSDRTSYYDFGTYLLKRARGTSKGIKKGSMEDFLKELGRVPRPRLGGFDSKKTQKILGMKFRTWKEMVDEFVRQVKSAK